MDSKEFAIFLLFVAFIFYVLFNHYEYIYSKFFDTDEGEGEGEGEDEGSGSGSGSSGSGSGSSGSSGSGSSGSDNGGLVSISSYDENANLGNHNSQPGDTEARDCEGPWGDPVPQQCPAECGQYGTQTRHRTVTKEATNGGSCVRSQQITCYTECESEPLPPPQNCVVSGWYQYGDCNHPCGGGTVEFRRHVEVSQAYGGTCDYDLSEIRSCNTHNCPVNCIGAFHTLRAYYKVNGPGCYNGEFCIERKYKQTQRSAHGGTQCPHSDNHTIVECNPVSISSFSRGSQVCRGPKGGVRKFGETAAFEDGNVMRCENGYSARWGDIPGCGYKGSCNNQADSYEACRDQCSGDHKCRSFQYSENNKDCWLHDHSNVNGDGKFITFAKC